MCGCVDVRMCVYVDVQGSWGEAISEYTPEL